MNIIKTKKAMVDFSLLKSIYIDLDKSGYFRVIGVFKDNDEKFTIFEGSDKACEDCLNDIYKELVTQ